MHRPTPPAFLYFDLGQVLVTFDHEITCRQMAAVSGASVDRVREVVFHGGLEDRYESGQVSTSEFHRLYCEQTRTSPSLADLMHAHADIFEINVPVLPLVAGLARAGHRMGILSNTCESHWEHCARGRFGILTDCFEIHALSYNLQSMKPAATIYEAASRLADTEPEKIFFVDDRPENVEGARRAGFDAVLFTTAAELAADLFRRSLRFCY